MRNRARFFLSFTTFVDNIYLCFDILCQDISAIAYSQEMIYFLWWVRSKAMSLIPNPIENFYSYAHQDENLRKKLEEKEE